MDEPRKIYLSIKTGDIKDLINFFKLYKQFSVKKINEESLKLEVSQTFDINALQNTREMIIEEIYVDFTAFVLPKEFDFDMNYILEILPELNPGIYTIEKLIIEITMLNKTKLRQLLKNFYYSLVNQETVNTVIGFIEANMNASSASKRLFMHRNTLNYRLDHFIEKTEINIRDFTGAMAIYMLFRR